MTKPKRLSPEYEEEVHRAIFDIDSLVSASHLLPRSTIRAAMRDVIRAAINRSIGKAEVKLASSIDEKFKAGGASLVERVDNTSA